MLGFMLPLQTSIGPNSVRNLCVGSKIHALTRNVMYSSAANVYKDIEPFNTVDMKVRHNALNK